VGAVHCSLLLNYLVATIALDSTGKIELGQGPPTARSQYFGWRAQWEHGDARTLVAPMKKVFDDVTGARREDDSGDDRDLL
jgi:hypothetical protein